MTTKFRKTRIVSAFVLAVSLIAPPASAASVTRAASPVYDLLANEASFLAGADIIQASHRRDNGHNRAGRNARDFCVANPRRCVGENARDRDYRGDDRHRVTRDVDRPRYRRGYRGYNQQRDGYRRDNDGWWYPLAAFAIGAVILNQQNNKQQYHAPASSNWSHIPAGNLQQHDNWCDQRYRSYSRSTKTFQPYNGPRKYCNSPYDLI